LLERHPTDEYLQSPITGLVNPTHFGRPDIRVIMEAHYEDICKVLAERLSEEDGEKDDEVKVGVFFCGPPVIGQQIANQYSILSARARNENRYLKYRFMVEVFG
jgi:dual oxidase